MPVIINTLDAPNKKDRRYKAHFENLLDVERHLASTPKLWSCSTSTGHNGDVKWDLGVGFSGAMKLAREGWPEGAEDVGERLTGVPARAKAKRDAFGVAGYRPDVGRFLSGQPDCMVTKGELQGNRPAVVLYVAMGGASMITANQFINFGAAVVACIDQIEAAGRRVEVNGTWASDTDKGKIFFSWNVKQAEDPVDLGALAFSLGHPAAARRLAFALAEHSPQRLETYSYGTPITVTQDDVVEAPDSAVFLEGMTKQYDRCKTLEDALRYASGVINRLTGEQLVTLED